MVCRSADFEANRSYLEDSLLNLNLSILKANVLYENNQDLLKKWPLENIDPVNHYLGFNIAGEDIFCAHAEAGNENSN